MALKQAGQYAGTKIRFVDPKDEVEALEVLRRQESVRFFDKRERRIEKREAKAKAKITLPRFSWDKEKTEDDKDKK